MEENNNNNNKQRQLTMEEKKAHLLRLAIQRMKEEKERQEKQMKTIEEETNQRIQIWEEKHNKRLEQLSEKEWIEAMMEIRCLTRMEAEELLNHLISKNQLM